MRRFEAPSIEVVPPGRFDGPINRKVFFVNVSIAEGTAWQRKSVPLAAGNGAQPLRGRGGVEARPVPKKKFVSPRVKRRLLQPGSTLRR